MAADIAVIGGGAAGMMAALTAARCGRAVHLYEKNFQLGKKLLATGNGRCNLANGHLALEHFHGSHIHRARQVLEAFGLENTLEFWRELGLELLCKEEAYGRLYYPYCQQAKEVRDLLERELRRAGVEIYLGLWIEEISREEGGAYVLQARFQEVKSRPSKGGKKQGDRNKSSVLVKGYGNSIRGPYTAVILAAGGKAQPALGADGNGYSLAASLGLSLEPALPALVPLEVAQPCCKAWAGVRVAGRALLLDGDRLMGQSAGELQLTDYGLSGIAIFQISGLALKLLEEGKRPSILLDFWPHMDGEEFRRWRHRRCQWAQGLSLEEAFRGLLPQALMEVLLEGIDRRQAFSAQAAEPVYARMRAFRLDITGSRGWNYAQVSQGGVSLEALGADLESIAHPGLFVAGELADVYGDCGGYNLQWAWSSGYVAGRAAAGIFG